MNGVLNELVVRQIMALSEQGFGVKDISEQLGVDELDVKLCLRGQEAGEEIDRDITDDDLKKLRKNAVSLALSANDEGVQAKLTMFLIERDKPKKQQIVSNGISPTQINIMIQESNKQFAEMVKAYSAGTVNKEVNV